jgi:hypothetical protein
MFVELRKPYAIFYERPGALDGLGIIHEIRTDGELPYGRKMRSPEDDHKLIKSWTNLCEQEHTAQGSQEMFSYGQHRWTPSSVNSSFRLIDLDDNCVVTASWDVRYVALSSMCGVV